MGIDKECHPSDYLYNKYRVTDHNGKEKEGMYFCLKLDTKDPLEHEAVTEAIIVYANIKARQGFKRLAQDLVNYVNSSRPVPTFDPPKEKASE